MALRFMPGLIDAVRSAVSRESEQLFDKLAFVAGKVGGGVAERVVSSRSGQAESWQTLIAPSALPHLLAHR